MFGFKRKRNASRAALGRFHLLLLSGEAGPRIMEPIAALPHALMERAAFYVDPDGKGGMVVTADDPSSLTAKYVALGFKVGSVTIPQVRPDETALTLSVRLRATGEYQAHRRNWLGSN